MKRLLLVLVALVLGGCTSFLHWKDPGAQAVTCAITDAVLPEIEALVRITGFPDSVIQALYTSACTAAAAQGLDQEHAQRAGLAGAQLTAERLQRLNMRFQPSGGPQP